MPSISQRAERHVVIDRRPGHYLCFPDVCAADDGRLVCVYNEFDRHVGARRSLLLRVSRDLGKTWGKAVVLDAADSHCPRVSRLEDGGGSRLAVIDDGACALHWSADDGATWARQPGAGLGHGLLDRVQVLDPENPEVLMTAGHLHRGAQPQPRIRQAPAEQMFYLSRNRGRSWEAHSVIASEKCLVLCEASLVRLPGKGPGGSPRLLALMRENSFVGEPMYACLSEDGGATWGDPRPTPLIGHRPTLGWTRSGKLLVTYRDVGPDPGTKVWLGSLGELLSDFAVHGLHPEARNPRLTRQGLLVKNPEGRGAVRYALRPLTDPARARATLEAEVLVRQAGGNGCGLRLGIWWRLFPDCLAPDLEGALPIPWKPGRAHRVRIEYEPGLCRLFVDGRARGEYPVNRMDGGVRPVLAGAAHRSEDNACEVLWRSLSLRTEEPGLDRVYDWAWDAAGGAMPDAWAEARVLELRNDRRANPADFGYSGWTELPGRKPGRFFCAYHHGGGEEPGYTPGESAHVAGTWFGEEDFVQAR